MIEEYRVTIPSLTGNRKKRRIYVYLPEDYEANEDERLPVLYMFDGQNVFFDEDATYGKSWGLKEHLDFTGTRIIVVAVECNNDARNGRVREYAPFSFDDEELGHIHAKGQESMRWLVDELKPWIDSRYRTNPFREGTFIAGSSMGGLMTLYALCNYNAYFSRGAALSPSLEINPKRALAMLRNAQISSDTLVYMDMGELEFGLHEGLRESFSRACAILINKGVRLECRIIPDGDHSEESWERQNGFFLDALTYGL